MNYDFEILLKSDPEPKLQYTGSGQKVRLLAALAPQHRQNDIGQCCASGGSI
jgi:hypothetical protein